MSSVVDNVVGEPGADISVEPEVAGATRAEGFRLLLPFARSGAPQYIGSAVLAVLGTVCQLGPFWVIYRAVSGLVQGTTDRAELLRLTWWALAFVIAQHVLLAASTWMSHRAAFATLEQLRLRIGDRLGRVPLGFITSRRSGEIQRTMNDDVERLEAFLAHAIPDLVSGAVVVLATTVWMFLVDWRMALAALVVVVISVPMMSAGMKKGEAKLGLYMQSLARMNGSIVEFVRGLPVVRTFNRSDETFAETRSAIEDSADFQSQWGRDFLPLFTTFYTLLASNIITIVPIGLWLWTSDRLSTSDLLFFFIVGFGYPLPLLKLMEFTSQMGYLSLSANLVDELDSARELPESPTRAAISGSALSVESVDFGHVLSDGSRRDVLADVSLQAPAGTLTAIVGPSGSGKSTLARLLCRFWDVDGGAIRIGGVDIREMPFEQLMEQVAFVFQETFLFDDTIAANLRLGRPDASDADVEAAARAARAHEFILAKSDGYATRLGERGAQLSGGERQRLAIARAILKDAPIIVLDEATAFADPENEAAIQEALNALAIDKTVIVIAHRLSTIVGADQIVVLDAATGEPGRVVEVGQHDQLVAAGGLYARMWAAFEDVEGIELGDAVHARGTAGDTGGTR